MKTCYICKISKDFSQFYKRNRSKDGYDHRCRECSSIYHKEYNKKTNFRNKYRENHKEEARAAISDWGRRNKDKINKRRRERIATDLNYKLSMNLRHRFTNAIKNNYKNSSAVRDLGCSIEKFKLWIEMQWKDGMSWDNYGPKGWHLDHKIPISAFNLIDRDEQLKAIHFTNLQPLWAKDNLIKSDKIITGD